MRNDSPIRSPIRHCAGCEQEYDASIERCHECGRALSEGPVPEPGPPIPDPLFARGESVFLVQFDREGEARDLETSLRAAEIPVCVNVLGSVFLGPASGSGSGSGSGSEGGVAETAFEVRVGAADEDAARRVLERAKNERAAKFAEDPIGPAESARRSAGPMAGVTAEDPADGRYPPLSRTILIAAVFAGVFAWIASSFVSPDSTSSSQLMMSAREGMAAPIFAGMAVAVVLGGSLGIYVFRHRRVHRALVVLVLVVWIGSPIGLALLRMLR